MLLGDIIKCYRQEHNMSLQDFAELMHTSRSYVHMLEKNFNPSTGKKINPSIETLGYIANAMGITIEELLKQLNSDQYIFLNEKKYAKQFENHKSTTVFIYNSIPANVPIECIEDVIDTEEISEDMLKDNKEYFGFKINDNTMEPDYIKGDVIILEKTEKYINGEDCIVMINGNDGIFKRVFINENGIILQPLNNSYQPVIYSNNQINSLPIKIVGVVRELRRKK